MMSITIRCVPSVSAIVIERYVNIQTYEKKCFYNEMHCRTTIFEDSVSVVILVAVNKIYKMTESGSPRLGVNEVDNQVWFLDYFNNCCIIK